MKKIKTIISRVRHIGHIGLIGLICLVSCSKDDGSVERDVAGIAIGGVRSYATYFGESDLQTRSGEGITRAWDIPSGYTAYEDGAQPIAIAFTEDGEEPKKGFFFKVDDKWRTNIDDLEQQRYYLYGFIPNLPVIKYGITDYDGGADDADKNAYYSMGAIMTLEDVPTVMPTDFCVVIGAKDGTDAETVSGLRQGDFAYVAKAFSGEPGSKVDGGNYVFLLFDHLYAALRINMKVHADYAEIRTIKLKSLQLSTQAGETKTTKKTTINIRLSANDVSASPIEELTFTPDGDPIDGGIEFWSNAAGTTLTTAFQPFIGHFMPDGVTKLVLTSVYDVYDRNGNLIRQDCKATNTMVLSELILGQTETERGKRYTINMTIMPTYLYMLSEPDVENPVLIDEE